MATNGQVLHQPHPTTFFNHRGHTRDLAHWTQALGENEISTMEESGSVTFDLCGTALSTFRYSVSVVDGELQIWLEDCVTKEQWLTKSLVLADFIKPENTIPQATMNDYAAVIVHCLAGDDNARRELTKPAKDGSRILSVRYVLQHQAFTTTMEYSFALSSVPLDATDRLDSRLRSVEDTLRSLKSENENRAADLRRLAEKQTKVSASIDRKVKEYLGPRCTGYTPRPLSPPWSSRRPLSPPR